MKIFFRTAIWLVGCLALLGCHRKHDDDLSQLGPPSQRLVGHWTDGAGDSRYYGALDGSNGKGNFFIVLPDGKSAHHHYQLLNEEISTQTAVVNLLFADGASRSESDVISADGQKLTVGTLISDDYSTETLQRVDGTTVPPKSYYMAGISDTPTRPEVAEAPAPHWTPPARTLLDRKMERERAVTRYASYLIWLHATALGMLLVIALMYQSSLGWPTILIHWAIAIVGGAACLFLLHAPIGAGILEIAVALVMLTRALFPKSSFG